MIFGSSLGPYIKKAFQEKAFQTNIKKIVELLSDDPRVSNMDAVVLGPKDFSGTKGSTLSLAVQSRHPAIGVIFFYRKDKEAELIDGNVEKIKLDRVLPEDVKRAVDRVIELHAIGRDQRVIESADNRIYGDDKEEGPVARVEAAADEAAVSLEPEVKEKTLEQRIGEIGQFADFDYFKTVLDKESVLKELKDNVQYAEVVKLLETLDRRIAGIFADASVPAEARFEQVKQIAIERAALQGLENSLVADKVSSLIRAIVQSAEATVDKRIADIREALDTISHTKLMYEDQEQLKVLIESRMHLQMDLMELSKTMIELYRAMDSNVDDLLHWMGDKGPTRNDYVNELLKPIDGAFLPQNMAAVANKLIGDLRKSEVTFSIAEDKIKSMISLVFKLCEEDATIIEYQQKLIQLLQTQRVENIVIVDNVIKNALRLFVGPAHTGRTATALTWSGIVSRRHNTLLIDLTGNAKLRQYGVETVSLTQWMDERLERPFLCVEGDLENDLQRADEIVAELKTRMNYYPHIHMILDTAQVELLNRLASSALAVHFITDCTPRGTSLLKEAVEAFQGDNIARKVILIDPPIDPIRMVTSLSIDPLTTKVIILPRLQYIRACSLNRTRPYDSSEVVEVFEEAFR